MSPIHVSIIKTDFAKKLFLRNIIANNRSGVAMGQKMFSRTV